MAIVRFDDPFMGLSSLHSQLDDMFNSMFGSSLATSASGMAGPAMDVYTDDDKKLVAEVHAPGFTKDDVTVSVHDGVLEIKGEKHEKEEHKDKKRTYMVRQSSSNFFRRISLPKVADDSAVTAHFDKGVLTVTVPFKELPQPKHIAIEEPRK